MTELVTYRGNSVAPYSPGTVEALVEFEGFRFQGRCVVDEYLFVEADVIEPVHPE